VIDVATDVPIIAVEVQECRSGRILRLKPPAMQESRIAPTNGQAYILKLQMKVGRSSLHIPAWEKDELLLVCPEIPARAAIADE